MARAFPPTLREKKRYVVYAPADDLAVTEAFAELFGIHGAAKAGIMPVEWRKDKSILRVSHTSVDRLKAAIAWCGKHSVIVSGTLRKARERLD